MESNANYVGNPKPKIRTVTYWIQKTPSTVREYVEGELDVSLLNALEIQYAFDPASSVRNEITVAMLTDSNILRIFDQDTFVIKTAYSIPGVLGTAGSLLRLPDGVAFRTNGGQVFIVRLPEKSAKN